MIELKEKIYYYKTLARWAKQKKNCIPADLAMTDHYSHGSIESAKNVMMATKNMQN